MKSSAQARKKIILLHGWRQHARSWRSFGRALARYGYHCYAVDLLGFGKTPLTRQATLDDYADAVEQFMAANDIVTPIVIGHSFGGKIAMILACRGHVRKLALIATNLGLAPTSFYQRIVKVGLTWGLHPIMRDTFHETHIPFSIANLAKSSTPTIIIHSKFDPIVPYRQALAIRAALPNSRLFYCYRALHRPHIEHRHHVIRLVREYIDA